MTTSASATQVGTDPTKPSYRIQALRDADEEIILVDDLSGGTKRMRAKSTEYIPKWPDEHADVWRMRRMCEPVFGGFKRTLSGGVGMLWSSSPRVTWGSAEQQFRPVWDNLDGAGNNGQVVGARFVRAALSHGLAALFVDHTPPPEGVVVHAANERELGLQPLWTIYTRRNVVNARARVVNNRLMLTKVVLREQRDTDADDFGSTTHEQFRVLELIDGAATWVVWKAETGTDGVETLVMQGTPQPFLNRAKKTRGTLPVAIAYTGTVRGLLDVDLPLIDVAYTNLAHWQLSSDLTFNTRFAGFEQMVIVGDLQRDPSDPPNTQARVKVGPGTAIHLRNGGSVSWSGPSGSGLQQLAARVQEKAEQMDQQGLNFLLSRNDKTERTATEVEHNGFAQFATLTDAGIACGDAMNLGWEFTGWFMGVDKANCPVVHVNTEFGSGAMDANVMAAYTALVAAGFPRLVVLKALQQGKRIPEDEDLVKLAAAWDMQAEITRQAEADARADALGANDDDDADGAGDAGNGAEE